MKENCDRRRRLGNVCGARTQRTIAAFTLVELLVVVGIIVVLLCLLLPTVRTASEAARRNQCQNNLKQVAIALQNYVEDHGALPPANATDEDGKPLHSWRTLILPYMEEQQLYLSIYLAKPWDAMANAKAFTTRVPAYHCPSASDGDKRTKYLAVVTPNSCFRVTEPRSLSEITNRARTLVAIEVDAEHAVPWMLPQDADEKVVLGLGGQQSNLAHPGVVLAVFLDGHVEAFREDMPAAQRRALISVGGNDNAKVEGAE
jgi:type II secretory pathway pseudopilin PulG